MFFKKYVAPYLVYSIYRLLLWTWKVQVKECPELKHTLEQGKPVILAHWHGDEIALLQTFRLRKVSTIVSTSEDGEMMNRLIHLMGGETSRGSSTRGGVGALKGLIRLVRGGWSCSFAVDGPKGPIYKAKPGVFEIAKLLQLPIYFAGVSCNRMLSFPKSWNKTYVPKPFARIIIDWQGPMLPPSEEMDPRHPELALELENRLHAAKQQAARDIAVS